MWGLGCAGCEMGSSNANAPTSTDGKLGLASLEIHSSLEGMRVLPRHVPWSATVDLPADEIEKVVFLVDGERLWSDTTAPYSYGEEGAVLATPASHYGGRHRFTVKVVARNGKRWRETVVARVPKPKIWRDAPAFGIWGRRPMSVLAHPRSVRKVGPYTSNLNMVGGTLWVGRTIDHAYMYELSATRRRFIVGEPIFRGSDENGVELFGWSFNGYQCGLDDSPATYT